MAKNFNPRYTIAGSNGSDSGTTMAPTLTTAAADYTGISANNKLVFTADATNGSRLVGVHCEAVGTNTQSVLRVYVNNGSANTTAANNSLVGKVTLLGTTASNTVAEPSVDFMFAGGVCDLEPGFCIYAGLATTVAAGWVVTPILGGDF
jgi:hypothetical protein